MITESIVASAGANIPAPFAIPTNLVPLISKVSIFGFESVVIIPLATSSKLSGDKFWHALSIPCKSASIGSRTPIRPVEQIPTSPDEIPRTSATFSADLWVSAKPSGPVHAFAPPLLRSTAAIV